MSFIEKFTEIAHVYNISKRGGVEERRGYTPVQKYIKDILKKLKIPYREITTQSGVVKSKKNLVSFIGRGFVLLARTKNAKGESVGYMINFTWQRNMRDFINSFIDEIIRKEKQKNRDPRQLSVLLIARQGCEEHTAKRYLEKQGITNIKVFFLSNEAGGEPIKGLLRFIPFGSRSYNHVSTIFFPSTGEVLISRTKTIYNKPVYNKPIWTAEMLEEYPHKIPNFLSIPINKEYHSKIPFFYTVLE